MATFNQTISSNSNDWQITDMGIVMLTVNETSDKVTFGDGITGEVFSGGFHFTSVTIPQGATINSAHCSFYLTDAATGNITMRYYGEDIDDASVHTTASHWTGAARTTAYTEENIYTGWDQTTGSYKDTADISGVIQEIVDRGGWSSGNDINILVVFQSATNDKTLKVSNGNTANGAKITIDYTASGNTYNETGSGGMVASGAVTINGRQTIATSGGVKLSGFGSTGYNVSAEGGVVCGGENEPSFTVAVNRSILFRVANNNEDWQATSAGEFAAAESFDRIYFGHDGDDYKHSGYHFNNVTIPPGADIASAVLYVTIGDPGESPYGSVGITIYGEDIDDATPHGSYSDWSNANRTTASSGQNIGGNYPMADTPINTSDFSAVIQEIIDRPGWAEDNDLNILIESNTTGELFAIYNAAHVDQDFRPRLEIDYSIGVVPVTEELTGSGVVCNGTAVVSVSMIIVGGTVCGGSARVSLVRTQSASGGARVNSTATVRKVFTHTPSGGVRANSTATVRKITSHTPSGGIRANSTATVRKTTSHTPSGGIRGNSTADVNTINNPQFSRGYEFKLTTHRDYDVSSGYHDAGGIFYIWNTIDNPSFINKLFGFMNFPRIDIDQGAKIVSAYIKFALVANSELANLGETITRFEGHNVDNSLIGTDDPEEPLVPNMIDPPLTTAYVDQDWSVWTTTEEYYNSNDLSSIIEEIIGRSGWSPGNDLSLYMRVLQAEHEVTDLGVVGPHQGEGDLPGILYITAEDSDSPAGPYTGGTAAVYTIINQEVGRSFKGYDTVILADSPHHYWRLSETSGSAINLGSTGSFTDGTYSSVTRGVTGLVLSTDDDAAAEFTGSSYVSIPDHGTLNIGSAKTAYSIEAWFSVTNTTNRQVIYEQGGGSNGFNIYVRAGSVYVGAWSLTNSWSLVNVSTTIEANKIYHVALVYDGSAGTLKGYLNGSLIETNTNAGANMYPHSGDSAIGGVIQDTLFDNGSFSGNGEYFTGTIDEVAAWHDVALSSDQIFDHWSYGSFPSVDSGGTATISISQPQGASGGIVGSGQAFVQKITQYTPSGGIRGNSTAPFFKTVIHTPSGGVKLSGVVRHSITEDARGGLVASGVAGHSITEDAQGGLVASGSIQVQIIEDTSGGTVLGGSSIPISGNEITTSGGILANSTAEQNIIFNPTTGIVLQDFDSIILADNPTHYWRLSETSGSAINLGSTGSPTDGTYSSGVTRGVEALVLSSDNDTAAQFNGADYVDIPDHGTLNTTSKTAYSIEAWFNVTNTTTRQVVYEQGGGTNGINIYVRDGSVYVAVWSGGSGGFRYVSASIQPNTTYQVALVFDGTAGTLKGYLNGSLFDTNSSAGSSVSAHTGDSAIGATRNTSLFDNGTNSGEGDYFTGTIDEVAIWNQEAITETQIYNHWVAGSGGAAIVASGDATIGAIFSQTTSGGVVVNGTAFVSKVMSPTTSGGLLVAGSNQGSVTENISGGLVASGTSTVFVTRTIAPSGGSLLSGTAQTILGGETTGGSVCGGAAVVHGTTNISPSGGIVLAGSTFAGSTSIAGGGVVIGGPGAEPIYMERVVRDVEYPIDTASHDWQVYGSTLVANEPFSIIYFGHDTSFYRHGGFHISSFTVPAGAVIASANMHFVTGDPGEEPHIPISIQYQGEDVDDADPHSSYSDWSSASLTTATVGDNIGGGFPVVDSPIVSPDISAIIQEIIDRPGWAYGNGINILVTTISATSGELLGIYSADHASPVNHPYLSLTYHVGDIPDTEVGSGGIVVNSTSAEILYFIPPILSAGLLVSAEVESPLTNNPISLGGNVCGGSATVSFEYTSHGSGGSVISGVISPYTIYNITTCDIELDDADIKFEAPEDDFQIYFCSGQGVDLAGSHDSSISVIPVGGIVANGSAYNSITEDTSGGIRIGGIAHSSITENTSGGTLLNGTSSTQSIFNILPSGGVSLSGTIATILTNPTSGGSIVSSAKVYSQTIVDTTNDWVRFGSNFNQVESLVYGSDIIYFGDASGFVEEGGFHFTNVDIPSGAKVQSAYLTFGLANSGSVVVRWHGEDVGDASPHTTLANFTGATLTTAYTEDDLSSVWSPQTIGVIYKSSDITTVIQEIVDRSDWVGGNNINILGKRQSSSNSDVGVYSSIASVTDNLKPQLIVNFSSDISETTYIEFNPSTSGGTVISGSAFVSTTAQTSGGLVGSGLATSSITEDVSGGIKVNGTAISSITEDVSGGGLIGGSANQSLITATTGGVAISGSAITRITEDVSGGSVISGTAIAEIIPYIASAGIVISGSIVASITEDVSGGVVLSATAPVDGGSQGYDISGGATMSGSAIISINTGGGGLVANGEALVGIESLLQGGGIVTDGMAVQNAIYVSFEGGGILASGSAQQALTNPTLGGTVISGSAKTSITEDTSGGLVLSGIAWPTITEDARGGITASGTAAISVSNNILGSGGIVIAGKGRQTYNEVGQGGVELGGGFFVQTWEVGYGGIHASGSRAFHGRAVELNGIDQQLTCADNEELSLGDFDFGFTFWANLDSTSQQVIACKGSDNTTSELEWKIEVNASGKFEFNVSNGSTLTSLEWSSSVSTGIWYFIAAWYDSAENYMYLQIDDNDPVSILHYNGSQNTSGTFRIGSSPDSDLYYDGRIDSFGYWKKPFNFSERGYLFNNYRGRTYSEIIDTVGLIAWWDFSEDSGIVIDSHSFNDLTDINSVTPAEGLELSFVMYQPDSDGGILANGNSNNSITVPVQGGNVIEGRLDSHRKTLVRTMAF